MPTLFSTVATALVGARDDIEIPGLSKEIGWEAELVIVTADEIDPARGLSVETLVKGKVEQSGTTADLIFSVPDLIVYLSQFLTLDPGDLIATSTPAGVGAARTPPGYLSDGDVLTTRIEGIGKLIKTVRIAHLPNQ